MKKFSRVAAQGEITIRRIGDLPDDRRLPDGFTEMKAEDGVFVIGHSEAGHHHVIGAEGATVGIKDRPPEGMKILYMILENSLSLEHLRSHDVHETIVGDPGVYEVRIAREFDHYAELARKSAD